MIYIYIYWHITIYIYKIHVHTNEIVKVWVDAKHSHRLGLVWCFWSDKLFRLTRLQVVLDLEHRGDPPEFLWRWGKIPVTSHWNILEVDISTKLKWCYFMSFNHIFSPSSGWFYVVTLRRRWLCYWRVGPGWCPPQSVVMWCGYASNEQWDVGVSIVMGVPHSWMVYKGNTLKMDDEQGYSYLRKPPYNR